MFDISAVMSGADEASLVGRRREVDAVIECVFEKRVEVLCLAAGGVLVVADWLFAEEEGEHGADLGHLQWKALCFGRVE